MKKTKAVSFLLAVLIALCLVPISTSASNTANAAEVVDTATGVTSEMCTSSYWKAADMYDADQVLLTASQIKAINQAAVDADGANTYDLEALAETTNAADLRASLSNNTIPTTTLYIDGVQIEDNTAYFTALNKAIYDTAYSDTQHKNEYAVAVAYTDMKGIPVDGLIGYSADDTDDEYQSSALMVNEPFVIRQKCVVDGKTWYWGYSTNCSGWVRGDDLAICSSKTEWTNAWKVDVDGSDFIVVTQDKITLEPSYVASYSSEVKLTLGSVLKLVANKDKPTYIGERGTWNNYVVYLPTRDENGKYVKKMALISQHYSVNVGYLPLTQGNILDVAFSCLGNRYGWGGMLQSFDCSLYTRTIYRCFGFELPRNTTWQQLIPNTKVDLSTMTEEEKAQYIETLPVGSLLYFNGHTMMYVGAKDGVSYVISALGTASDSVGDLAVKHQYCVALTPLTVRRWSGNTWLHDLNAAVVIAPAYDINDCEITAAKACDDDDVTVTVSYNGKTLYETTNYTYTVKNGKVTVTGTGTFTSSKTVFLTVGHQAVTDSAVKATCTKTGLTKGSHCSVCGTVLTSQKTVAKTEHTYYTAVFAATPSLNGKTIEICSVCGTESNPSVVYKASSIALSKTSYTYDGKVKKPSVVVKDSEGNVVSSKNYTVSYESGRKAVGTYQVKVTLKGIYSGSKTLSFKIKPQSTTISSVSAKANGFVVKWKKQATQTTGYQIRYSVSSDMSNAVTKTVKGKTKTSQTVTGLAAKKKYYVQVRTYKTVDGKKIYSAWSAKTAVKTK